MKLKNSINKDYENCQAMLADLARLKTLDPWEFGDGYQKRTALWGNFNFPVKNPVPMTAKAKAKTKKFDYLKSNEIHPEEFGKMDRQARRAITPQGFAQAFFKANQ